jgi:tRNA threonylcarbamoyl adenosine modification protein YjeE
MPFEFLTDLSDESATVRLAEDTAAALAPGDVVALAGGLGTGKTTFARALIRALADDASLEVPSPTFTLIQTYASGRLPVAHIDLYRLSSPDEVDELGLDEVLGNGAAIIEWPEKAEGRLPSERIDITLSISGAGRSAIVAARGPVADRLSRSIAVRSFVDSCGWSGAQRRHLQGDASSRIYERVATGDRRGVLMNWPARPEGAPVKDGLSYDAIAHRTRDVRPFMAIDAALRDAGFAAPEIYASDVTAGFLLLEDFGSEGIVLAGQPDADRYAAAIEVLAAIHSQPRPAVIPSPGGGTYSLPPYDRGALAIEAGLMADWYMPQRGQALDASDRAMFDAIWSILCDRLAKAEHSWVLRDVHSPNLLWLAEREGLLRVGLIDFQDALFGPSAYDVASLLQDARVTVPGELEERLRAQYVALRRAADPAFDAESFITAYAIAGAQRATKVLGIFARLAKQAGKPGYLKHLPRVGEYLRRNLAHPVLSDYRLWYEKRLPPQELTSR